MDAAEWTLERPPITLHNFKESRELKIQQPIPLNFLPFNLDHIRAFYLL